MDMCKNFWQLTLPFMCFFQSHEWRCETSTWLSSFDVKLPKFKPLKLCIAIYPTLCYACNVSKSWFILLQTFDTHKFFFDVPTMHHLLDKNRINFHEMAHTLQEENFHRNFNFANGKLRKLLDFYESFNAKIKFTNI